MKGLKCVLFAAVLVFVPMETESSGSLYDPPNRAVMWKYGFRTNKNYNYMQLNCGGVKQPENGTFNCGICGDPADGERDHEQGGKYGSVTISRYYPAGLKEITIKVELLVFEKGFFEFRICPADNNTVTQECLDENLLPIKEGYLEGTPMRYYPKAAGDHRLTVAINPKLTCERCVLQWRYHTANSWGVDPVTKREGLGLGPQEEFRNCADIRIGGEVPVSVKSNPFFGPLHSDVGSQKITKHHGAKTSNENEMITSSLSIQPEHADHLPPNELRNVLFDGSTKTTSTDGAWVNNVLDKTSGHSHGRHAGTRGSMTRTFQMSSSGSSGVRRAGSGQFGGGSASASDVDLKKFLQPADGRMRLTAGTDVIRIGKGSKVSNVQSGTTSSRTSTTTRMDDTSDGTFALDNRLSGDGSIKVTLDDIHSQSASGMDNTIVHRGAFQPSSNIKFTSFSSSSSSHGVQTPDNTPAKPTSEATILEESIAAGVTGHADGGQNLEIGLQAQDISSGTGSVTDTVAMVGPPPNPATKQTITLNTAAVGGTTANTFGSMKSATRSGFSFVDKSSQNTGFGASSNTVQTGSKQGTIGGGQGVIYDSVSTGMTGPSQPKAQDRQRIFQIKVNKPMRISEGVQPKVGVSQGSGTDMSNDVSALSGVARRLPSDQYDTITSGSASSFSGANAVKAQPHTVMTGTGTGSTNEIDTFRNELVKTSLKQGGVSSPIFANSNTASGTISGEIYTGKVTGTQVGDTASQKAFDSNSFIETNVNAIVNEANAILKKSEGGARRSSIDKTTQTGNRAISDLFSNTKIDGIPATNQNLVIKTNQATNTVRTGHSSGMVGGRNNEASMGVSQGTLNRVAVVDRAMQGNQQLGGSTIDMTQPDVVRVVEKVGERPRSTSFVDRSNRIRGSGGGNALRGRDSRINVGPVFGSTQSVDGRRGVVIRQSSSVDRSNRAGGGSFQRREGGTSEPRGDSFQRREGGTSEPRGSLRGRQPRIQTDRRPDGRMRSGSPDSSVNIERQLNSFDFRNIPSDVVMNADVRRRDGGIEFRRDGRMTGRTDVNRMEGGFDSRLDGSQSGTRREERVTSRRQDFGTMDSGRRDAGGERRVSVTTIGRRGSQQSGFRIETDPRTGLEIRVPVRDSFAGAGSTSFGRHSDGRSESDLRFSGSESDTRGFGSRMDRVSFDSGTSDLASSGGRVSGRERTSFGTSAADRRDMSASGAMTGTRDPQYFVDLSGADGARRGGANATDIVVDTRFVESRVQDEMMTGVMPRDPVAAFGGDLDSSSRVDVSFGGGRGGATDRLMSGDSGMRSVDDFRAGGASGRGLSGGRGSFAGSDFRSSTFSESMSSGGSGGSSRDRGFVSGDERMTGMDTGFGRTTVVETMGRRSGDSRTFSDVGRSMDSGRRGESFITGSAGGRTAGMHSDTGMRSSSGTMGMETGRGTGSFGMTSGSDMSGGGSIVGSAGTGGFSGTEGMGMSPGGSMMFGGVPAPGLLGMGAPFGGSMMGPGISPVPSPMAMPPMVGGGPSPFFPGMGAPLPGGGFPGLGLGPGIL